MASTHDYEDSIAAGEQDIDDMKEKLSKLRNLSDDDRTEGAMLRSRIDEQSNLIMMLKTRSDENLLRAQALERANEELVAAQEVADEMLQQEINKASMIERRFYELAENHEEMIKLKEDYKRQNTQLREENQRLAQAVANQQSKEESRRIQETTQLTRQLKESQDLREILQEKLSVAESVRTDQLREHRAQLDSLRSKIAALERRANEAEARALVDSESDTLTNQRLAKEMKEKQEYLELSMQRGKLIQDKQSEIRALQQKWDDSERRMKEMSNKFALEVDSVNVNVQVQKLREDLAVQENRSKALELEYSAYKQHTSKLLQSEKELNSRLRNLFN